MFYRYLHVQQHDVITKMNKKRTYKLKENWGDEGTEHKKVAEERF